MKKKNQTGKLKTKYKCNNCNYVFPTKYNFEKHKKRYPNNTCQQIWSCPKKGCGKIFKGRNRAMFHNCPKDNFHPALSANDSSLVNETTKFNDILKNRKLFTDDAFIIDIELEESKE